jgi:hypothetical protein
MGTGLVYPLMGAIGGTYMVNIFQLNVASFIIFIKHLF